MSWAVANRAAQGLKGAVIPGCMGATEDEAMRRFAAAAPPATRTPTNGLTSRRAGAWNQSSGRAEHTQGRRPGRQGTGGRGRALERLEGADAVVPEVDRVLGDVELDVGPDHVLAQL